MLNKVSPFLRLLPQVHKQVVRRMGGHGPPAHWKSIKQVCIDGKAHMDFLPVPSGSWQAGYAAKQKKMNTWLGASIVSFFITYYVVYQHTYLHGDIPTKGPHPFKDTTYMVNHFTVAAQEEEASDEAVAEEEVAEED